jgi:uncharacterized membrane protein
MLYALLKTVHLLGIVAWVGGMFFTLYCLRPAVAALDGPVRVRLMQAVLAGFFKVVIVAAALVLVTGAWMMNSAAQAAALAGGKFNMPLDWYVMAVLGLLMVAVFGHIRFVLFKRLQRAVDTQAWPAGAQALGSIRSWVMLNLGLGVVIVVATQVGSVS